MKFDIVTFGSAVMDTFVDTEYNKKTESFNYPAGAKILAHNMKSDVGGGATNTAVAFSRLGFFTGCICKVGYDAEGNEIVGLLKSEKIKFLGSVDKKERTGHSIILDSKNKRRTILTYKGPGNNIKLKEIPKFSSKWLYLTGTINETFKTQEKLVSKLKKKGTKIAFNPGYINNNDLKYLLSLTDVLVLNKEEAIDICKKYKKKGNLLVALRDLGPSIVAVTDKNNFAFAFDGDNLAKIKPNNKIKVVERTGAGDAFASGFVAGIMKGKSLEESLKLGLEEGESVIGHFGAKNNLIKRKIK